MAEPALPQRPETTQRLQNEDAKRDNAPISLPAQSPRRSPPSLSPRPAFSPVQPSPKKETARIPILPRPSPSPAVVQPAPGLGATSKALGAFDSIPRWFCWGLLGLSALIFLTQIWNYALS